MPLSAGYAHSYWFRENRQPGRSLRHNRLMDPQDFLPRGLRLPPGNDLQILTVTSEVGANSTVGAVAARLADLQIVLDLGERWGTVYAEAAANRALLRELQERGPEALRDVRAAWPAVGRYASPSFIERALLDPEYFAFRRRPGYDGFTTPEELLRLVSSSSVPQLLGQPLVAQHIEYRNPLEVVVVGAGFVLMGAVTILRVVRDWSSQRSIGDSIADTARSAASLSRSRAELGAWLVEEAKAGRLPVPISDLIRVVTTEDLTAIGRLADSDMQLSLPPHFSESGDS